MKESRKEFIDLNHNDKHDIKENESSLRSLSLCSYNARKEEIHVLHFHLYHPALFSHGPKAASQQLLDRMEKQMEASAFQGQLSIQLVWLVCDDKTQTSRHFVLPSKSSQIKDMDVYTAITGCSFQEGKACLERLSQLIEHPLLRAIFEMHMFPSSKTACTEY